MPNYAYHALDADGHKQQGELEAADEQSAADALQQQGLLVLNLRRGGRGWRPTRSQSVFKAGELVLFTQQLATLIGAGQPLDRALTTLLKQLDGERRRRVVEQIREAVKAGEPLSQALQAHSDTFSPFYISLVRAGEAGGVLDVTLKQLSDYLERTHNLRSEVINASIYPLFLVVGVIGSVALLLTYVVPQFEPIFNDLGVTLPLITQGILAVSSFLESWGMLLLAGLVGGGCLLLATRYQPRRRLAQDQRLLGMRGIGPLLTRLETARLARTLGTLLGNGVTLLTALHIARDVSTNRAMRAHLIEATDAVKQGSAFADAIATPAMLPELAVQMIEVGEQSGTLGEMLMRVADVFDVEAKRVIDRLLAALVPTLTLVMAVLVAAIMLAIMLPLMSLTSNI
ncbi:type II secretion system F family protein [Salinicola aestuarinus]|uniref:type II secretion system F family protein n=1 Tax=Salinicola aestuarinus TaxID=1949082 RepID=UPI000DA185CA|nr:type II secretion system F family protein [Salinicola aestuarinus]